MVGNHQVMHLRRSHDATEDEPQPILQGLRLRDFKAFGNVAQWAPMSDRSGHPIDLTKERNHEASDPNHGDRQGHRQPCFFVEASNGASEATLKLWTQARILGTRGESYPQTGAFVMTAEGALR